MSNPSKESLEKELSSSLFRPDTLSCPHAIWARMRAECPVPKVSLPHMGRDAYLVTRKDDLEYVSRHPELFTSEVDETVWRWGNDLGPEFAPIFADGGYRTVHTIVTSDPPAAHRYRKIVLEALSPKRVNDRKPQLQKIIDKLIAKMPPDGEAFDFRTAFSVPLPLLAILQVFGLPEEDADFVYWFTCESLSLFDPNTPVETALENARSLVQAQKYLAPRIEDYRRQPADNFLSFIANATDEQGKSLSMEECLSIAFVTLIGGNETSRNALTTAAFMLATDRTLWETLRDDPSKIENFAEEAVRVGSPATVTARQVAQDNVELAGVHLPKGASIYMLWGSGSHDERFFEAPEQVRLDRKGGRNHTSFGHGVHHCAGIHLARSELIQSIATWLEQFEAIELAVPAGEIVYEPAWAIRAIGHLPMRVTRRK